MSLRIDTISADAFAFARMGGTLEPRPIPQSLRNHVRARQFDSPSTVLLAKRPASADLSDRVARWREAERDGLPLRPHPDQTADDGRLSFALAVTAGTIFSWTIIGVVVALIAGKL